MASRQREARERVVLFDAIRFNRADGRCECVGQCGRSHVFGMIDRCGNAHGRPATHGADKVVSLAVRHLDGDERNEAHANLIAMCQTCVKRHRARLQAAADKRAEREATTGGLFTL
ncbi:HNH endonuclease [Mycobacterium phage Chris]|uniref:HNH endonuclease n=1 Tax=Mycobacterium phage Chris TaxID=2725626 RepID=A0A6M3SZN6_9CAUD|nr:HNH endonuclease [Mycobacterium phage Chris]QJD50472.1 HNH endonuclease [Mycobacterium phage Chris]